MFDFKKKNSILRRKYEDIRKKYENAINKTKEFKKKLGFNKNEATEKSKNKLFFFTPKFIKKANKKPKNPNNAVKRGKLAVINHTPPALLNFGTKLSIAPKIAVATYYRALPQTKREKKFYIFIFAFLLIIVGSAIAAGVVYGQNKLSPISQDNYKFNIPFFLGADSSWKSSPDATNPESSFGSKLNTHIEIEYAYTAKSIKTRKLKYTIIDLSKKIDVSEMKKQLLPMDISQPFEIYVYSDLGGKDIHFAKDSHNVVIPTGRDVMKYTNTPGTSIYPTVYEYTDQNKVTTKYNCNEISSSSNSSFYRNAYSGIPLFSAINLDTYPETPRAKVNIQKGKNPAFGIYISNFVNYYADPISFSNKIFDIPIPPPGILIPSLSLVIKYFIPSADSENPTLDDSILNGQNYSFDEEHYTESSALYWKEQQTWS